MHESLQLIVSELRSAWRFRWMGICTAWGLALVGLVWVIAQPPVYEGSARVYLDTTSALRPVLSDRIVAPDFATQLEYVRQALLRREQLQRVARETNLDVTAVTAEDWEGVLMDLRSEIRLVSSSATARRGAPENIYAIYYRNADRETAVAVVTSLLNAFVEDALGANRMGSMTAERFLDERIAEYEARLQRSERSLAEFKRRHVERLPGAAGGYFAQIQKERNDLENTYKALRLAESRRDRLREQLDSETPVALAGGEIEPPPNSIDARIRDHTLELDRLLLQYTDRHPDVTSIREALERLQVQRLEQLEALGIAPSDRALAGRDANPVYQALQIAINETEVEIATLQADVADRERKLEHLQTLVDEVPQVEAELARLNRDYEVVSDQYQALVQSRETQSLTRKASDADQVEFRIIEPPLASFEPVAPNRLQLLALVFAAALGAGAGVCWLLAQLRPVFSTPAALRNAIGLPVLGAVSQAWEARHRTQKRIAIFGVAGATVGLVALFAIAATIELVGPGLHALTSIVR